MLLNYFKTEWQILRVKKFYYVVNIVGLAIGIASSILIMLWVVDELSYEKMHEKADRVMLLYKKYKMGEEYKLNASLPYPLAPSLIDEVPEITEAVRVVRHEAVIDNGMDYYNERNICATDNAYFELFSFTFIQGDPARALTEPYSVVLTQDQAEKYFGADDPMGKTLEFDKKDTYTVTGVIENIEGNTDLDYNMMVPIETIHGNTGSAVSWYDHFIQNYVYVEKDIIPDTLNSRLTSHIRRYMSSESTIELVAQPIREIHLKALDEQNSRAQYIYIFSIIGFLIILIACINFTNVSTALSVKRSKEIGVKKVNGAGRKQLFFQFMGEAFHQVVAGFLLAMMLVELFRPLFNQMTGKSISIPYLDPAFILAMLALVLLTTVLAGSYPALLISSFNPVSAFQGKITTGKGQASFRTCLLVFQFTISIGLIITTLIIYSQIRYINQKNLGYDKENLLYVYLQDDLDKKFEVFRQELMAHPMISNAARASSLPSSAWSMVRGMEWEGKDDEEIVSFSFISVDPDFVETVGMEMLAGRDFSKDFAADTARFIINEEAKKFLGFEDPVGRYFLSDSDRIEIIGVVNDFHSLPLTYRIEPLILNIWPEFYTLALIRIGPGNLQEAVDHIEKVWNRVVPGFPFEYNFVDENIDRQYRSETRIGMLSLAFTVLAILITCIGLFAIAAHTAQQKTKEVGVRKSHGASSRSIIYRFVTIYLKWVLLANLIAWPIAWILMNKWLENFAYQVSIGLWIFALAAIGSVIISVLTISWHAWNVSNTNPVNTLRYE
jgi:putative ABC transport system permease protein